MNVTWLQLSFCSYKWANCCQFYSFVANLLQESGHFSISSDERLLRSLQAYLHKLCGIISAFDFVYRIFSLIIFILSQLRLYIRISKIYQLCSNYWYVDECELLFALQKLSLFVTSVSDCILVSLWTLCIMSLGIQYTCCRLICNTSSRPTVLLLAAWNLWLI